MFDAVEVVVDAGKEVERHVVGVVLVAEGVPLQAVAEGIYFEGVGGLRVEQRVEGSREERRVGKECGFVGRRSGG